MKILIPASIIYFQAWYFGGLMVVPALMMTVMLLDKFTVAQINESQKL